MSHPLSSGDASPAALLRGPIALAPDTFTANPWGGDWIPQWKKLPAVTGPVGESWDFSTHAKLSTGVPGGAPGLTLRALIASDPASALGAGAAQRFHREAPFLLKFIDARDDLSVQVHPDADQAREWENENGKSEAWIITGAENKDSAVYLGFDPVAAAGYDTPEAFEDAFLDALNEANAHGPSDDPRVRENAARVILPFLNKILVGPGDVFWVSPGTIHAIGRGVRLFEIQQTSDVTYRVWDWNRADRTAPAGGPPLLRPLHIDKARRALRFEGCDPADVRVPSHCLSDRGGVREERLIADVENGFCAHRLTFSGATSEWRRTARDEFDVLTVIDGALTVRNAAASVTAETGRSVFLPAAAGDVTVTATDGTVAFRSFVPSLALE